MGVACYLHFFTRVLRERRLPLMVGCSEGSLVCCLAFAYGLVGSLLAVYPFLFFWWVFVDFFICGCSVAVTHAYN